MDLFGFTLDFKFSPKNRGTERKDFSALMGKTSNGIVDGQTISRNLRTYMLMYRHNSDLKRCVEEISQTAMKSGYELQKTLGDKRVKTVEDEDIESALNYGKVPVRELKNRILQSIIVFGTVFIRKRRNLRNEVIGFEVLDTRYVNVYTDSDLVITRYTYQNPIQTRGGVQTYSVDDIKKYTGTADPDNPLFGMTQLEALVTDVMSDEEASLWNYYFFVNDANPSSLYIMEDGLDTEQQNAVYERVKDTLTGGHNKHKNIVSPNIKDIKQIKGNHTDSDFLNQRKFTTERICAALGVPKIILSYTEGVNYSSSDIQYKKFIENTIRPYERLLEEIFTDLIQDITSGISFSINDEHIDDLEQRSKIGQLNVTNGIWTRNEARDYIGYDEVTDNEMMSEFTSQSTQTPLDSIGETEAPTPIEELPAAV